MNKMAFLFWKGYYLNVLRNGGLIDDEEYAYLNATVGADLDKDCITEYNNSAEAKPCTTVYEVTEGQHESLRNPGTTENATNL